MVTHDSRIFDFADVITHMEDGKAVGEERKRINGKAAFSGMMAGSMSESLAERTI